MKDTARTILAEMLWLDRNVSAAADMDGWRPDAVLNFRYGDSLVRVSGITSVETVRSHMRDLESDGWITKVHPPEAVYRLSPAGRELAEKGEQSDD